MELKSVMMFDSGMRSAARAACPESDIWSGKRGEKRFIFQLVTVEIVFTSHSSRSRLRCGITRRNKIPDTDEKRWKIYQRENEPGERAYLVKYSTRTMLIARKIDPTKEWSAS